MTMTEASVDVVKALRERTGAGIMDCKAALQASGGDLEKSIDFLRKKGVAQAAKRAGREAKEGLILSRVEAGKAVIVEANCETDFVARTDDFKKLAELALAEVIAKGESALHSETLGHRLAELSGKIGEKLLIRRARSLSGKGIFFSYIHSNNKLGVLVELEASKNDAALQELGKNLAMQVAASNPICVRREEMPGAVLEREKDIFREEVKGKPANIVEKILQGKLEKFYQSTCLLEQPFIRDDKQSVKALIAETAKKTGGSIEVKQFVRFQIGETLPQ